LTPSLAPLSLPLSLTHSHSFDVVIPGPADSQQLGGMSRTDQEPAVDFNKEPNNYHGILDEPPWRARKAPNPPFARPPHGLSNPSYGLRSGLDEAPYPEYQPQEKMQPADEGCCMTCMKGMLVFVLLTLIFATAGYFGWNWAKEKFFPEEEKPYQYDASMEQYQQYDPYAFGDAGDYPGQMALPEAEENPHPGRVYEIKNEVEMQTIVASRVGLVILMFYQTHCQYCHAIDPVYRELATTFPAHSFLKVNLDNVDMGGDISSVPMYYFFCESTPVHTLAGPRPEELRKSVIEAIRICGAHIAARHMAAQQMQQQQLLQQQQQQQQQQQMQQQMMMQQQGQQRQQANGQAGGLFN